ncbi:hypothetical protein [Hyphomonas sp.]|uniref:hypothetical protein n=1 Tax=Hyphomonas sp. TaxID=87 RepID=UPI001D9E13B9|nr:hypothetical protein [Hyphomonas sp.]
MKHLAGTLFCAVLFSSGCTNSDTEHAEPAEPATPAGQVPDSSQETMSIEEQFPDYEPKLTPDTLLDYRPGLLASMPSLPEATVANLPKLMETLEYWRAQAEANPGGFEPGNMPLGADAQQYEASDAELMWALAGQRVADLAINNPDQLRESLPPESELPLTYPVFAVRHVDVMGSGRFFYVSEPDVREINIDTP